MLARVSLVGALILGAAGPRSAHALDQGEWQVSAGSSFALLVRDSSPVWGVGGRLEGRYGLRDDSALWAAIGTSSHPHRGETARATGGSAGFSLAFDVLRIIPFLAAGVACLDVDGALGHSRHLGVDLAVGGEYLLDRHWSAAAVSRYQYLPIRVSGSGEKRDAGLLTLGVYLGRAF